MKHKGFEFKATFSIELEKDDNGKVKTYFPSKNYNNLKKLPLHKYGKDPFCKFKSSDLPNESGVYLVLSNNKIKYVGETINLRKRINTQYGIIYPRNCFKGGRQTNCRLNKLILSEAQKGNKISFRFLKSKQYKSIEKKILLSGKPEWNIKG